MSKDIENMGYPTMPWMTTQFGWVFTGYYEVTDEDYAMLEAFLATGGIKLEDVQIDQMSLCGRLDPFYTAGIWVFETTTTKKFGGLGSHTYETQRVIGGEFGSGDVEFKPRPEFQFPIWHINPEGVRVKDILDYDRTKTAYHVDDWGQTVAGPKPGTAAYEHLGDDRYGWNTNNRWWVVRRD